MTLNDLQLDRQYSIFNLLLQLDWLSLRLVLGSQGPDSNFMKFQDLSVEQGLLHGSHGDGCHPFISLIHVYCDCLAYSLPMYHLLSMLLRRLLPIIVKIFQRFRPVANFDGDH
jgi:hypothetical protein